jgi:GNAT superfamily N-acetyltransferase
MDFSIEKYYFQNKYDNYDWRWITEPFDRKVFTWFAHIKFLDVVIVDNRPFSEDNGKREVVGKIEVSLTHNDIPILKKIMVVTPYQKKGIGTTLLTAANIEMLKQKGSLLSVPGYLYFSKGAFGELPKL